MIHFMINSALVEVYTDLIFIKRIGRVEIGPQVDTLNEFEYQIKIVFILKCTFYVGDKL